MEFFNLFVSPFVLAFGIFLINEKNRKINRTLGIILISLGGYFFIDSIIFIFNFIKNI